jgi:putative acetyltransferase
MVLSSAHGFPQKMLPATLAHLSIRTASNRDCQRVVALVSTVLAEYGLLFDPQTTDSDLQDLEANYLNRGGAFEVIEDREYNLIGSVGVYPIDEKTCELRKMYFVPKVRGLGLGQYILQRTIGRARELGFSCIVLETSSRLEAANRLYAKFGFKAKASEHLAARADQAYSLEL